MLHHKMCVNDGINISKMVILMLHTRNMENRPKNMKMWNCKHCWMKMIPKHKHNLHSNWELLNKLFLIAYEIWEKFRRLLGTKGSRFCII